MALFCRCFSNVSRRSMTSSSQSVSGTLNEKEVNKFRYIKSDWWDPQGSMKPLHAMNDLRVPLVRNGLMFTQRTGKAEGSGAEPLSGTSILDVGCGGGILAERLARLGADVTAVDAAEENIEVARAHLSKDPLLQARVKYFAGSIEDFAGSNGLHRKFDAVVASEVVEHVANPSVFVSTCSSLVDEGGSFFLTTINKTYRSYMAAIVAAEYVLRLLPMGTHNWNKFVTPEELQKWLRDAGCSRIRLVHGLFYIPLINKWTWVPDTSVNYAIHAVKPNLSEVQEGRM